MFWRPAKVNARELVFDDLIGVDLDDDDDDDDDVDVFGDEDDELLLDGFSIVTLLGFVRDCLLTSDDAFLFNNPDLC